MTEADLPPGAELADVDIHADHADDPASLSVPAGRPRRRDARVRAARSGIKNVTMNEWFFQGHFPAEPIMPGVLLVEAMAQTAAVLAVAGLGPTHQGQPVYFMSIDERPLPPPRATGRPDPDRGHGRCATGSGVWKFGGKALCEGALAAEAEFSAKISLPLSRASARCSIGT